MRRMMRINANNRRRARLCLLGVFVCLGFVIGSSSEISKADADNCINCHIKATGRAVEVVEIHKASTHGKVSVGCAGCHGGDTAQTEKAKAHAGKFIGKPDKSATLAMCGTCHQKQLTQFITSRHFPESRGIPRLDCADCHGAHSIGNPPEQFSFVQFCAGCHGLEYLPALAQPFQDLLTLSDGLRGALNRLSVKGGNLSDDVIRRRKEIRHLTADIIHPTDREGGFKRIPGILSRGEYLKEEINKWNEERIRNKRK